MLPSCPFNLLIISLTLVLQLLLPPATHHSASFAVAAASAANSPPILHELKAETKHLADSLNIRHGRSKVRRSNEKEHILWSLRPQQNSPIDNAAAKATAAVEVSGNTVMTLAVPTSTRNVVATNARSNATLSSSSQGHKAKGSSNLMGSSASASSIVSKGDHQNSMSRRVAETAAGDDLPNTTKQITTNTAKPPPVNLQRQQQHHKPQQQRKSEGLWSGEIAVGSIETGNGHLFGSDYWLNSDANGTLLNAPEISYSRALQLLPPVSASAIERRQHSAKRKRVHNEATHKGTTDTPDAGGGYGDLMTTKAPVTHRIRKLHMKKIMESLRNSGDAAVDGMKSHHRSLVAAEQLQGRPMDVELKDEVVGNANTAESKSMEEDEAEEETLVDSAEQIRAEAEVADEDESESQSESENESESDEGECAENRSDQRYIEGDGDSEKERRVAEEERENETEERKEVDAENSGSDSESAEDGVATPATTNNGEARSKAATENDKILDSDQSSSSADLNEVLQLADELDMADSAMAEEEEELYQNDDYVTTRESYTATTTYSERHSRELYEPTEEIGSATPTLTGDSTGTAAATEDAIYFETTKIPTTTRVKAAPKKAMTTKLKLIPKMSTTATKTTATTTTTKSALNIPATTKLKLIPTNTAKVKHNNVQNFSKNQSNWPEQKNQISHFTTKDQLKTAEIVSGELTRDSSDLTLFDSLENVLATAERNENVTQSNYTSNSTANEQLPNTYEFDDEDEGPAYAWPNGNYTHEPNQLASTNIGAGNGIDIGIGMSAQQSYDIKEINFEQPDDITMDDGHMDNRNAHGFPVSNTADETSLADDMSNGGADGDAAAAADDDDETSRFLVGVVNAANEDEIYDWDEISRNNRRNLMRGRDVVTKFLQIVETQHLLGANCEAGTSLNLGEGVVDRYAQDRFRVEAEVAVNRANMLTRIFKMTTPAAQADVNLLHASVLSMVEFDDDIFAAGNCFDWNEHPAQMGLFCPFAYRLPAPNLGAILAKDLSMEYHYLGNTSEWFFQARKNAEKVIARNEQYLKSFHLYSNKTEERIEYDTLAVKYEDGRWSKPYYDCGGGNIWMLTYTVPFFGYENGTYHFKGTSGIDIDLRRVDIDQCPQRNTAGSTQPLNIFAGTDKCKQRTTMCEALKGLGFRRGSYKCVCRKGYYFPDTISMHKFFNGSLLEEEYEKLMLGRNSTYNIINEYECLPCAEGCDYCEDGSPCIAALNWPMRTSILVLACTVIGLLPPAAWFTFRYQQVKVVRAASPALLRVIALGAFFIYCTNIVMYPNPNLYTCSARIWLREIGFSLTYGALMLKTWRISVIFRVRSAKAVKITDAALLKRLGIICGVIGTCLLVRTLVAPPDVVVGRTADDLKAFLCKTDYWDYTFTSMEVLFLAWGVRLCIMVRKAPSEFNESRFISMAIYNEFLMTCFLNVSMLFLQSPANPDLLYIIFFCHTQLTVTLLLGLIFGSKVYIVLRSGKSHQETIGMGAKSSGAKFNFRPQVRTFANPSSITTSTAPVAGTTSGDTKLSDQEALEEIRQLSIQLQRIQEMAPPKGVAVMTISSLLDGLKTPSGMLMVAAAASQAAATTNNKPQQYTMTTCGATNTGALPLLALNTEIEKYNQQLQTSKYNNNIATAALTTTTKPLNSANGGGTNKTVTLPKSKPIVLEVETSTTTVEDMVLVAREDRAVNTDLTRSEDFHQQALGCAQGHIICTRCMVISKEHYFGCRPFTPPHGSARVTCEQLGSPQPEGSISFANIKLDCMCSQPDLDLDEGGERAVSPHAQQQHRRRVNVRTAATNTPPSTGSSSSRKRRQRTTSSSRSRKEVEGEQVEVIYSICDNCKNKFNNKISSKCGGGKFRKSTKSTSAISTPAAASLASTAAAKAIKAGDEREKQKNRLSTLPDATQTRSNDLIDRQPLSHTVFSSGVGGAVERDKQKMHSTDDILFYTTTDDDDDDDDSESDSEESTDGVGQGACSSLRKRRRELVCKSTSALSSECTAAAQQKDTAMATMTTSQTSVAAVVSGTTREELGKAEAGTSETTTTTANAQSVGNISNVSNTSVGKGAADTAEALSAATSAAATSAASTSKSDDKSNNGAGRAKRPDKLILDLNDRSKYTKEVSV